MCVHVPIRLGRNTDTMSENRGFNRVLAEVDMVLDNGSRGNTGMTEEDVIPPSKGRLYTRIIARQMLRSKARFISIFGSTVFSCMAAMAALSMTGASDRFEIALMIAAVSCLVTGVVSISQSLHVAAVESRADYSILLVSGFSPVMVKWVVIIEAMLTSLAGAIVGCVTGYVLAGFLAPFIVNQEIRGFDNLELVFRPWAVVLVLFGGVLTAVIAALGPAKSAVDIDWSSNGSLDYDVVDGGKASHARMMTWAVGVTAFMAGIVLMVWNNMSSGQPSWMVVILECALFIIGFYVSYPLMFRFITRGIKWVAEHVFHVRRPSVMIALRSLVLRNTAASAVSASVTVGLLFLATVTMIGAWDSTADQIKTGNAYGGITQVRLRKSTGYKDFRQADMESWALMDGVKSVVTFGAHELKWVNPDTGKQKTIMYYTIDGNPFDGLIRGDEEARELWDTGKGAIIGCEMPEDDGIHVGDEYDIGSPGDMRTVTIIGQTCNPWLDGEILVPAQLMPKHDITSAYIVPEEGAVFDSTAFSESLSEKYPGYVFLDREHMIKRFGAAALWELLVYYGAGALVITVSVGGLFTLMALSVMQRKREIGLLSAYGMGPGQVRASLWLEAGIISLLAGVLGTGIGCVVGMVIGAKMGMIAIDSSTWMLEGWLVVATVIVGVFAAVIPSFVAIRAGAKTIRDE